MMTRLPPESSKILEIYLLIAQYPILASRIRQRMRQELFRRGIITPERFEQEVREKAILSQQREGLYDPIHNESAEQWEIRYHRVRRILTDFYFAYNLPVELLHQIIDSILAGSANGEREKPPPDLALRFNPELAPLEMVLRQAEKYEALPDEQRAAVDHPLQELRVVLLKSLISDQLAFINIARRWFTTADFHYVINHRIGSGKIGGKAAGMLLAYKILQHTLPEFAERIVLPRSYFIGADVFYEFMAHNNLEFINQKYKPPEQIREEYPRIVAHYTRARFPEEIADQLRELLREVGNTPLIVRSSSLLEDNFGTSFAGKYVSVFCPNQGNLGENLRDLTLAIRRAYASIFNPDVLMYRRRMGLLDYDERMAILIQEVQGETYRHFLFPPVAGVAYGYSPIIWNPRLRREEGFVRMVMGLGTRAVERTGNDYPRLVTLSHPQLRPEVTHKAIRHYSQHFVDVLDLEKNAFITLPVEQLLEADFPHLRWLVSVDDGDTIRPPLAIGPHLRPEQFVLTFDGLLQRSDFVPLLKAILQRLGEQYHQPVDVEFTLSLKPGEGGQVIPVFHLLQCRPQHTWSADGVQRALPAEIPTEDTLFVCTRMVPQGYIAEIEYIVYVDPDAYYNLANPADYTELARKINLLNKSLEGHPFLLIGPGRWGSTNYQQGVPVTYADIFNCRALIEVAISRRGYTLEPSYGTHFFQALVETRIYPLAIYPEEGDDYLNWNFLQQAQNCLLSFLPQAPASLQSCLKVIHIPTERPGQRLEILLTGQKGMGYFCKR
ncbi:MAG: PEP/pyruvate-binding domain-containing protein [Anaerolineales bacterium]